MLLFGVLWVPSWLIYVAISLLLVYIHYIRTYRFWKDQGVPGPTPLPVIGSFNDFFGTDPDHELKQLLSYRKYGPIYGTYEFSQKILTINDPELLKAVFVKDFDAFMNRRNFGSQDEFLINSLILQEDDEWKSARKILSTMFSSGKLKKMCPVMKHSAKSALQVLLEKTNGESFDARDIFKDYALDILGRCVFGIEIDMKDPRSPFKEHVKNIIDPEFSLVTMLGFLIPGLSKLFKIPLFDKAATDFFKQVIVKAAETRLKEKTERVDLVQMVIDALKEEENSKATNGPKEKTHFTYREFCFQCVTFFMAGIDTNMNALTLMAYNCALYPETQDKLIEEVDATLKKHGEINYDSVQEMPYLTAFLDETLRLYPPNVKGERVCSRDYHLGPVFIPKGTIVNFSQYCLHRDPEYWPNPEVFDPERFLDEESKVSHPYAYMPFLHGPRSCIAKRFAQLAVKLCFAEVLTKIRFKKSPNTLVPLKFRFALNALTVNSVDLSVESRM